jgi:hypothetical protein
MARIRALHILTAMIAINGLGSNSGYESLKRRNNDTMKDAPALNLKDAPPKVEAAQTSHKAKRTQWQPAHKPSAYANTQTGTS